MAAPLNRDDFEDDDFGDFGGFEAAEPVNVPDQVAQSGQAAPNVWAAMFAPAVQGNSGVQPDLLCGQNRFPQHLDNPLTLDVAGSAQASLPTVDVTQEGPSAGSGLQPDLDLGGLPDTDEIDLDNINLANDILDGSFRSAQTNQSGASFQSHGVEPLPDISGLDLAAGITNEISSDRLQAGNASAQIRENQNVTSNRGDVNIAVNSINSVNVSENRHTEATNQNQGVIPIANQVVRNELSNERPVEESEKDALLQRANVEKEALQKEIEKQLAENTQLSEDLARAQELAETARRNYEELQTKHEKQLEDLRQAGHDTLSVIVEEYKCLLNATVQQQQEVNERRISERMKEETERLREILKTQKEEFDNLQAEERKKNTEQTQTALEEMKVKQREEFDKVLAEERIKCEEKVKEEMEKEKAVAAKQIEKVIAEEQQKAKDMLDKEQENFRKNLSEAQEKHKNDMETALKEQKEKFQDQLREALAEERTRSRDSVQQTSQSVKDDMKEYLQQQREADRCVQRRQFASLDLFLSSARNQLSLLMENDSTDKSATSKSKDQDTGHS